MESKYERYNEEIINGIAEDFANPNIKSASKAARNRDLDVSGYIKHAKQYRVLKVMSERNKCSKKFTCTKKNVTCP